MNIKAIRLSAIGFISSVISVLLLSQAYGYLKFIYIPLAAISVGLITILLYTNKCTIVSEMAFFILAMGSAVYSYSCLSLDLLYGSVLCLLLADIILRHSDCWGTFVLTAGLGCIITPQSTLFILLLCILYALEMIFAYDILFFIMRHLTAFLIFGVPLLMSIGYITIALFIEADNYIFYSLQLVTCLEVGYKLYRERKEV